MRDADRLKERVVEFLGGYFPRFQEIALAIHARPELGNQEYFASELLCRELESHKFRVERPYVGLETGFRAEYGNVSSPKVAFLAEYDALPEIGHACGHNLSGVASLAAGLALQTVLNELPGCAVVLGTPDEEGAGGKIDLLNAGAFEDIRWAMMVHSGSRTILESRYRASRCFEFRFHGKSSHAVTSPEKGINALEALIDFYNALQSYKVTLRSDVRLPLIITQGGVRANIIPDFARAEISCRAADGEYLDRVVKRVHELAYAAAARIGAKVEITLMDRPYQEMKSDPRMIQFYRKNLDRLGISYESEPNEKCGSTDIGNVSHVVPSIHPSMAITDQSDMAGHTVEFAKASGSEQGAHAMLNAAKAMAMTAIDLLLQPETLAQK